MKTSDLKAYKAKINGVESTIVKKKEVEGRALPNLLFELGFKDHSDFYYSEGVHKILGEIKTMIKGKIYNEGELLDAALVAMGSSFKKPQSVMERVDNATTFEELEAINKEIIG